MLSDPETPPGSHARFVKVTGLNIRNNHNITLTNNDNLTEDEETTWSLPSTVIGFISRLFAPIVPMLIYGSNALFFFIYTWPLFLALMPVAVVVGVTLHSLVDGKLHYSIVFTLVTVGTVLDVLFTWLLD